MISRAELNERARGWSIREDVVEKDYVIGWTLWGIGADACLSGSWAFKGGTCLKKCYMETGRLSEDLDFTVLPGGLSEASRLVPTLMAVLGRVYQESGIDFQGRDPVVRPRPAGRSLEVRVYYRGPRQAPSVASLRLDVTTAESVLLPTVPRPISHPFPDLLPAPATVPCYSFEEVFAEKLRAMGERARPRDLYDIVTIFERQRTSLRADIIRKVYEEKCRAKGLEVFTYDAIRSSPLRTELSAEWRNMLAHQLSALPPLSSMWEVLPRLYKWLEGE